MILTILSRNKGRKLDVRDALITENLSLSHPVSLHVKAVNIYTSVHVRSPVCCVSAGTGTVRSCSV